MPRFPRPVGNYKDLEISVNKGRFGPYLKYNNAFFTLKKTDDPFDITLERSIELIEEKLEKERKSLIREFPSNPEIKVVIGRYGPCIKAGKKFFKIPAGKKPEELTLEECLQLTGANKPKGEKEREIRLEKKPMGKKGVTVKEKGRKKITIKARKPAKKAAPVKKTKLKARRK